MVRNAGGEAGDSQARAALANLCETYWYPVYGYVRRRGNDAHRAEDLTQGFFLAFIEKEYLKSVSQDKGKFRAFLLASVKNYMANMHDRETAQKRGGGVTAVPLDGNLAEKLYESAGPAVYTADASFDREWALTVLRSAQGALAADYEKAGNSELYKNLLHTVTGDSHGRPYSEIAADLSMSESAVKVAAHRLRSRYRKRLREAVAQTVSDQASIDEELRYLISCV